MSKWWDTHDSRDYANPVKVNQWRNSHPKNVSKWCKKYYRGKCQRNSVKFAYEMD